MKKSLLSESGRLYAGAWERHTPAPYALPSVDLVADYKHDLTMDDINVMPMRAYEGPVHIVRTREALHDALEILHREPLIGFDTETRPLFRKGASNQVALVQLATAEAAWLVQLVHVPFDKDLADLLATPHCIKTGVAIHEDMRGLMRIYPFTAAGVADLGLMAKEIGLTTVGLRSLSANLLGFRISKSVQCSNWEREELEPRQIRYAATDAWLGRELYLRLVALGSTPPGATPYRRPS